MTTLAGMMRNVTFGHSRMGATRSILPENCGNRPAKPPPPTCANLFNGEGNLRRWSDFVVSGDLVERGGGSVQRRAQDAVAPMGRLRGIRAEPRAGSS
ncbi:hypothetical protein [Nitratireductor soli]|uniref:hypothetical protein n=1 Tax=Nitratireductor soli TaxID=1670619 RepID=UPI0012FB2048|nr:hypothetical protein [Nitratireductor soli]